MQHQNLFKAALWMGAAVLSFSAMAVAGRELLVDMNTFELMLYRSGVGFVCVCAIIALRPAGFSLVRTRNLRLHLLRNAIHYTGQNLWFYAISLIALSQVVAIEFTNPIWVALLAPFLLGERLTRARLIAALLGFIGVLIVAQPGRAPIGPGQVAVAVAALCYALNTIYTKQIMRHDHVLTVIFYMTLTQGAGSLVLSLPGGIPLPSAGDLFYILVVGVTGVSAHFALTSALGWAPATIVAPMDFARLPLIAFVGALLYGETLSPMVAVGAAIIVCANVVNLRDGARRIRTA
ncbi:DMT family transporter [Amaricoccus solimangrovi]|uniref:DMT family transporter n=1 Tax=Amaricoccus solimangrovi TaxID=2589815 RepID=A0A501WZ98_9RHOB|nr:DMT family transporter [Amaricoccus solimangrovi]TPE53734.1 DMT family transporter [Amaricoccus solimangrovi]